jgi:hypothetical protein
MFSALALLLFAPMMTERFPVGSGHVEVWRSHGLTQGAHAGVARAFLMVHGTSRNAEDYYRWALASAAAAGELDTTVVVAPHFKARTREERGDGVEPGEWFWTNEGWKAGDVALNGQISSYGVMDAILAALNDEKRFPDLKEIVVAGHSAGGQYVQRYAALNKFEPGSRVPVRYVVANPSSYLYMNDQRLRVGATCSERGECTGTFARYWDAQNCTGFNRYRYGLEGLTGYASGADPDQVREQYIKRNVTYVVGELDTKTDDPNLDRSCPATAEGPNRRERGTIFWNYMRSQFRAQHRLAIAPGCGHSAVCVFAGPAGVSAVFGK